MIAKESKNRITLCLSVKQGDRVLLGFHGQRLRFTKIHGDAGRLDDRSPRGFSRQSAERTCGERYLEQRSAAKATFVGDVETLAFGIKRDSNRVLQFRLRNKRFRPGLTLFDSEYRTVLVVGFTVSQVDGPLIGDGDAGWPLENAAGRAGRLPPAGSRC